MPDTKQTIADLDMRVRINCFGDGMNEHISGPATVETAKELLRWADGFMFRQTLEHASEIVEERIRAEAAEAKVLALEMRISQLEAICNPKAIPVVRSTADA